jgi:hypothetical protein
VSAIDLDLDLVRISTKPQAHTSMALFKFLLLGWLAALAAVTQLGAAIDNDVEFGSEAGRRSCVLVCVVLSQTDTSTY